MFGRYKIKILKSFVLSKELFYGLNSFKTYDTLVRQKRPQVSEWDHTALIYEEGERDIKEG